MPVATAGVELILGACSPIEHFLGSGAFYGISAAVRSADPGRRTTRSGSASPRLRMSRGLLKRGMPMRQPCGVEGKHLGVSN